MKRKTAEPDARPEKPTASDLDVETAEERELRKSVEEILKRHATPVAAESPVAIVSV